MSAAHKTLQNPLADRSPFPYRRLGKTELMVSPICFGSLRLTPENEMYKESLKAALTNGVNFIDSSGEFKNSVAIVIKATHQLFVLFKWYL